MRARFDDQARGFVLLTSLSLLAQKDIAGEWDNRFDEDFLERIPGPDIGDYLGIRPAESKAYGEIS